MYSWFFRFFWNKSSFNLNVYYKIDYLFLFCSIITFFRFTVNFKILYYSRAINTSFLDDFFGSEELFSFLRDSHKIQLCNNYISLTQLFSWCPMNLIWTLPLCHNSWQFSKYTIFLHQNFGWFVVLVLLYFIKLLHAFSSSNKIWT